VLLFVFVLRIPILSGHVIDVPRPLLLVAPLGASILLLPP
jgi:hypothetical protein